MLHYILYVKCTNNFLLLEISLNRCFDMIPFVSFASILEWCKIQKGARGSAMVMMVTNALDSKPSNNGCPQVRVHLECEHEADMRKFM